ncbi:unnamed protein product [Auanema sp. JU1783]|nr:unnamed protein product [Auanema sp. JU1783]
MPRPRTYKPALYTTTLVYLAVQVAVISFFSTYYNYGVANVTSFAIDVLEKCEYTRDKIEWLKDSWQDAKDSIRIKRKVRGETTMNIEADIKVAGDLQILTPEQLALFDGTRDSRPVYLAILGRVYNVDKGKKHYGKGGGYHFFSGKDATRAFVTGDFTPKGLIDDTSGLSNDDLLGIKDWITFYEKDYVLVGVVVGKYYDQEAKPTSELQEVLLRIENAVDFKNSKAAESEIFPPCNSEWHQNTGGRVWCSSKSGGIHREWSGVPRLFLDGTNGERCVCVKNFGPGLSNKALEGANRGDLDHPSLKVYPNCSPTANSCKIES